MTNMTFQITLRYGKGYAGKMSERAYIARITGRSNQYGLAREFIEADKVEREHFNRTRTMIDLTWDLDPGLYELSEAGERRYRVVWVKDGKAVMSRVEDDRLRAMLASLDAGSTIEDARRATAPTSTSTSTSTSTADR